jgi:DNA repair photolyase
MHPAPSWLTENHFPRQHSSQSSLFPLGSPSADPEPGLADLSVRTTIQPLGHAIEHGSRDIPGLPSADCPPPSSGATPVRPESAATGGPQCHSSGPARNSSTPLVGIARLAADSPAADSSRTSAQRPDYFVLPVRSILNKCDSQRVPFEWTINPYRGCEFACKYCYARYTHEYMEIDGADFEKKIFVKKDAAILLAQELARKYSYQKKGAEPGVPEHIAIGTATDPYQPAEREFGITRACLEELVRHEGLSISIITKSNMIVRDIDLLERIAERSDLTISVTITTLRVRLARLLEPRAPRPDLRLAALRQLAGEGLHVGVSASPLVPGITDREGELEAVGAAAKEAGAEWFFSGALFLMPASARQFLPFVREKFPRLARQYDHWYGRNGYAPESYSKEVALRVARIRELNGFEHQPWRALRRTQRVSQLSLSLQESAA